MNATIESLVKLSLSKTINYTPTRNRLWANVRPIMGWPRPHLANHGKKYPEASKYNWRPYLPEENMYTTRPLPILKMSGRDLETGRVVVRTLGGGNKKKFRWVDPIRECNADGTVREERVLFIRYSPLHTPKIALVADAERQRWLLLTHTVEVGDIIRTYPRDLPPNPIRPKVGDAHPVGALPIGTQVHMIETVPFEGPKFCVVAGSNATITKRQPDGITILLPNKDSIKIDRTCMVTVGQLSNIHNCYVQLMCPQRLRWLGKRPRSGQWRRKDGWCGRKLHAPKLLDITLQKMQERQEREKKMELFDLGG